MAQRADVSQGHRHATQSPVPSLTNDTSRASSASSSVNTMSPDTLVTTTPRDLLPRFKSAADDDAYARDHRYLHATASQKDDDRAVSSEEGQLPHGGKQQRKRRRGLDLTEVAEVGDNAESRCAKRRVLGAGEGERCVRRRHLTGEADFVRLFGLSDLYNQFVRPYAGREQQRLPLPGLEAAYLNDVKVTDQLPQQTSAPDLLGLVMAPPKNDLDRLDLLSSTSIRSAFRVGSADSARRSTARNAPEDAERNSHKRPRVALKMSGDSSRASTPRSTTAHTDSQRTGAKVGIDIYISLTPLLLLASLDHDREHRHHGQRPPHHHRQQQQQQQQRTSPPKAY
ncbi:hypothetical protein COEREDRAFT_8930 [Coemansia reversa NRRL 1564]|uniref:Uncharacterized protein n=1 Tax=Coemansia reversa (strain ATCC 12441 / NRRL 1564) TaxID=763665 RepID=A0A2G5BAD0_COERN|nr:hypothetical protein COEREDRAFT_8930 [Coemansia reversa NRRL 1564]|eukprot:PIA15969.1 hypothetical protein COEREDRAFT_8930 [Coemansia reversa NRRL 1564]